MRAKMRRCVLFPLLVATAAISLAEARWPSQWNVGRESSRWTANPPWQGAWQGAWHSRISRPVPDVPAATTDEVREDIRDERRQVDLDALRLGLRRHGGDPSSYPTEDRYRYRADRLASIPRRPEDRTQRDRDQERDLDPAPRGYWTETMRYGRYNGEEGHNTDRRHEQQRHGSQSDGDRGPHGGSHHGDRPPHGRNPHSDRRHHGGSHHSDGHHEHHRHDHHSDRRHHPHGHGDHGHSDSSSSEEKRSESAPYEVMCVSPDGYELRRYEEAVWATTLVNGSSSVSFFRRLYNYIDGGNDQGVKIPMTKPVRKKIIRRQEEDGSTRSIFYSGSFYLSPRFWDNPPVPLDDTVFLERVSSLVFTTNFSGWADDWSMNRHYNRLKEVLEREGHPMVEDEFEVQCYNPPWDVLDRHNELLIEADTDMGAPTCHHGNQSDHEESRLGDGDRDQPSSNRRQDRVEYQAGVYLQRRFGHPMGERVPSWVNQFRRPSTTTWVTHGRPESSRGRHHHPHGHSGPAGSSSEEADRGDREHGSASYEVECVSQNGGFELRRYEEAVWVTTVANSTPSNYFQKLFRYISGNNDQGVKIPMTTPVRKLMTLVDDKTVMKYTFHSGSFYLPRRFWDDPPVPLDETVFLERVSSLVFTTNFSGWADELSVTERYNNFSRDLSTAGHMINWDEYYVQCYNPPWEVEDRHNEILIKPDMTMGAPTCDTADPLPEATEAPPNGIRQCGDRECPSYRETDRINDNIVIRQVEAGVYATKKSATCNMSNAMGDTYMPLREYFMGANEESVQIPTTIPVLQLAVRPDRSERLCNFTYESSFYIPEEYQTAPPVPLDNSIVISEDVTTLYYVMTFQENPTPKVAFQKYNELKSVVSELGRCYSPGEFRLAFYDAPFRPLPHRYEMWIPVDQQCNEVGEEEFDEDIFPINEEGNIILPVLNDEPRSL